MKVYGYRYNKDTKQEVLREIYDIEEVSYSGKDMGERQIVAIFNAERSIEFSIGDYIDIQISNMNDNLNVIERFYIYTNPTIKKVASKNSAFDAFEHTVTFFPPQYELGITQMRDVLPMQSASGIIYTGYDTFSFYGGAEELMRRIMAVLEERFGQNVWGFQLSDAVNEKVNPSLEKFEFSFSGESVWDALMKLSDENGINTNFYITNRTIFVGYKRPFVKTLNENGGLTNNNYIFKYGKTSHLPITHEEGGLYTILKSSGTQSPITRLYVRGSSRNINRFYCSDRLRSGRYVSKLMLPSFSNDGKTDWIDSETGKERFGIREGSKEFEEIYPSLRYMKYGDLRQIKYVIKIMGSGLEGDDVEIRTGSYPVARIQCYRVDVSSSDNRLTILTESTPPNDIAVFVHATGKVVKCILYSNMNKQSDMDIKVPVDGNGNQIIGSCFCVHENNYYDYKSETHELADRTVWFENPDTITDAVIRREVEMHQINYTDDSWITDVFVVEYENNAPKYEEQSYFPRAGYSAYCYPRITNLYSQYSGDSLVVNEVVAVGAVTIVDNDLNLNNGRQMEFDLYIRDIGFKINEQTPFGNMQFVVSDELKISFYDGNLGGLEFSVSRQKIYPAYTDDGAENMEFYQNSDNQSLARQAVNDGAYWLLKLIRNNDNDYLWLPNTEINANKGDHIILSGIYMPDVYIRAAENRLLSEAQKYLNNNDNGDINYSVELDSVRLAQVQQLAVQMREGVQIRLSDEDLNISTDNEVKYLAQAENGLPANVPMAALSTIVKEQVTTLSISDREYYIGGPDDKKVINNFERIEYERRQDYFLVLDKYKIHTSTDLKGTFAFRIDTPLISGVYYEGGRKSDYVVPIISIRVVLTNNDTGESVIIATEKSSGYSTDILSNSVRSSVFIFDIARMIDEPGVYSISAAITKIEPDKDYNSYVYNKGDIINNDFNTLKRTLYQKYKYTLSYTPALYTGPYCISMDTATGGHIGSIFYTKIPISEIGRSSVLTSNPISSVFFDKEGWGDTANMLVQRPVRSRVVEETSDYVEIMITFHREVNLDNYNHLLLNLYVSYDVVEQEWEPGGGLVVPCHSTDVYSFRPSKFYEVVMDVMYDFLEDNQEGSNTSLFLSQDINSNETYTPDSKMEIMEDVSFGIKRVKFSFYLPSSFNAVSDYFVGVLYVSDGITERAQITLLSIVETNTDQYGDKIDYIDLTIDELSFKLNDSYRYDVHATIKERQRASEWSAITNNIHNNNIQLGKNEGKQEQLADKSRRKFGELDFIRQFIFNPDGDGISQEFLHIMMLQVGADSMNYALDNTSITFNGQRTNMRFDNDNVDETWLLQIYADKLRHFVYDNGTNSIWSIASMEFPMELDDNTMYYVSVKCSRNSSKAEWYISTDPMKVDADGDYWFFNYGIISPVNDDEERIFTEMRGNSYVYGDNIIAGKISSINEDSYYDLTRNILHLGSQLHYENGRLTVSGNKTIAESIAESIVESIDNLYIGGENLAKTNIYQFQQNTNYILAELKPSTSYVVSWKSVLMEAGNAYSWTLKELATRNGTETTIWAATFDEDEKGAYSRTFTTPADATSVRIVFYCGEDACDLFFNELMLQEGNKQTSYTPNVNVDYLNKLTKAIANNTDIIGGLILTSLIMLRDESNKVQSGLSGLNDNIGFWSGGTYSEALNHINAAMTGTLSMLSKILPVIIARDGTYARIGCLTVVNESTVEMAMGNDRIIFNLSSGVTVEKNGVAVITITPDNNIGGSTGSSQKISQGTYLPETTQAKSAYIYTVNGSQPSYLNLSTISRVSMPTAIYVYANVILRNTNSIPAGMITCAAYLLNRETGQTVNLGMANNESAVNSTMTIGILNLRPSGSVINSGHMAIKLQFAIDSSYNQYVNTITTTSVEINGDFEFLSLENSPIMQLGANGLIIAQSAGNRIEMLNDSTSSIKVKMLGLPTTAGQTGELYLGSNHQLLIS